MTSTQNQEHDRPLHRLRAARENAELSLRSISKRTGLPIRVLREHEESNNIELVDLLRWRDALGVPIGELLCGDESDTLSDLSRFRAGLLQLMRGVRSLQQTEQSQAQKAFVQNMEAKLLELMPELEESRSWPVYGERRRGDVPARVERHVVATSVWFPELHQEH